MEILWGFQICNQIWNQRMFSFHDHLTFSLTLKLTLCRDCWRPKRENAPVLNITIKRFIDDVFTIQWNGEWEQTSPRQSLYIYRDVTRGKSLGQSVSSASSCWSDVSFSVVHTTVTTPGYIPGMSPVCVLTWIYSPACVLTWVYTRDVFSLGLRRYCVMLLQ